MNPVEKNKCNIECEWMKERKALVNPDGQVWPCCYLANLAYYGVKKTEMTNDSSDNFMYYVKKESPTFNSYFENKQNYNIMNESLENILNSEWFTKTLPESWDDSDKILLQCDRFCKAGQ